MLNEKETTNHKLPKYAVVYYFKFVSSIGSAQYYWNIMVFGYK